MSEKPIYLVATSLVYHILSWNKDYENQNSKNGRVRNSMKKGDGHEKTRTDDDSAIRRI